MVRFALYTNEEKRTPRINDFSLIIKNKHFFQNQLNDGSFYRINYNGHKDFLEYYDI